MTTSVYINTRSLQFLPPTLMVNYLSKYFESPVVAVERKSTDYMKEIYFVEFAEPIPTTKFEAILNHGEYHFWPEPHLLLRIYLADPDEIPPEHFKLQSRYVVATGDEYITYLNHDDSKFYIQDKKTYRYVPITENPFVF
jgi:hypothetical protein